MSFMVRRTRRRRLAARSARFYTESSLSLAPARRFTFVSYASTTKRDLGDKSESSPRGEPAAIDIANAEQIFATRKAEADDFYSLHIPQEATPEERNISRQAFAGLLWCKQFYYFIAEQWMTGDPTQIAPPPERVKKSEEWRHLFCRDVLSMPDKWEYPWFAAWDTAFHMIPLARIDPEFAKNQLLLLLREWYMHPNGQMPAYEFAFGDVNPPVHGWAVWHVYRLGTDENGVGDLDFLERAFQKLMLNFTWWVNRNDEKGHNLFGGGFLGLDNIGVFDRSVTLPDGVRLHQADGTAWMGLYCSVMLQIALELAHHRSKAYEDIASKFFEHYIAVIDAINSIGGPACGTKNRGSISIGWTTTTTQYVAEGTFSCWYRSTLRRVHYEAWHGRGTRKISRSVRIGS